MNYLYIHPLRGVNRALRRKARSFARRFPTPMTKEQHKKAQNAPFMTPARAVKLSNGSTIYEER